jgi:hypothetical protein
MRCKECKYKEEIISKLLNTIIKFVENTSINRTIVEENKK